MGSWDATCTITRTPISCRERAVGFFIHKDRYYDEDYTLAGVPMRGAYSDYGEMDIDPLPSAVERFQLALCKTWMHSGMDANPPPQTIRDYIGFAERTHQNPSQKRIASGGVSVCLALCHEQAYNEIVMQGQDSEWIRTLAISRVARGILFDAVREIVPEGYFEDRLPKIRDEHPEIFACATEALAFKFGMESMRRLILPDTHAGMQSWLDTWRAEIELAEGIVERCQRKLDEFEDFDER